jgi:trehalose/maltose transport system permease protein
VAEEVLPLSAASIPVPKLRAPSFARTRVLYAWLFLLPVLATLVLVAGWPLARTAVFSLTNLELLSLDEPLQYVWLQNYGTVLRDPQWWRSVGNTLLFTFMTVGLETVLGLAIAQVLRKPWNGRGWLRAVVLVPWAIPTVVSARMWAWMFHDLYGAINAFLLTFGIINQPVAWLAGDWTAFAALVVVDVWKATPFMALLLLAGLEAIPKDVFEAARLDSPSPRKRYLSVTLPLLGPTLVVAVLFRSLDALRVFDVIYVLTGANPATASMAVYARQRLMEFQEFGVGSAVSMIIFLFIGGLSVLYLRFAYRRQGAFE